MQERLEAVCRARRQGAALQQVVGQQGFENVEFRSFSLALAANCHAVVSLPFTELATMVEISPLVGIDLAGMMLEPGLSPAHSSPKAEGAAQPRMSLASSGARTGQPP